MTTVNSTSFRKMLARCPVEVQAAAEAVNEKSANDMANHIRRIAAKKTGTLISSVDVIKEADHGFTVVFGGEKTSKKIGTRTYDRTIQIGAGKDTSEAKKVSGGSAVVFDYARILEWSKNPAKRDPSYVPARRRAVKLHTRRMKTAMTKVGKLLSSK